MNTKICTKCNIEKPIEHFTKRDNVQSGRVSSCKKCMCDISKNRYKNNPEKYRKIAAEYRIQNNDNPEYKKQKQISDKKYYQKRRQCPLLVFLDQKRLQEYRKTEKGQSVGIAYRRSIKEKSIQYFKNRYYTNREEAIAYFKNRYHNVLKTDIEYLTKNKARYDKYSKTDRALALKAAREAKRRAKKLNATPKWADLKVIQQFYLNCPKGYHVDHIYPLQGELCSGLHVLNNLQYLPASENCRKSNKMPEEFRKVG